MATTIRYSQQVDSAFKQLVKRFESAKKRIDSSAAKRIKSGQYDVASKWMDVGREVEKFSQKVNQIRKEWNELVTSSSDALETLESKTEAKRARRMRVVPQQLFAPALKALSQLDGKAVLSDEILTDLHNYVLTAFPDSELAVNSPFKFAPWDRILRKVNRHFRQEGWVERRKDGRWVLTEHGRKALAESKA